MSKKSIAIIGAGISGLVLAEKLTETHHVELFEKARSVSGRLATRYNNIGHQYDTGAQFFIARNTAFKDFLQPYLKSNLLAVWQGKFIEITDTSITQASLWDKQNPHYVSTPKMTSWCKEIASQHQHHLNCRVTSITPSTDGYVLHTHDQRQFPGFDYVLLAMPHPQAVALLPAEHTLQNMLKAYHMSPCYSVSLGFTTDLNLEFSAALVKQRDISFISNNISKPGRTQHQPSITVLSTNAYAERQLESDNETVITHLVSELEHTLQCKLPTPIDQHLQRWRYANHPATHKNLSYFDTNTGIGVCGDWCRRGMVEAAFMSANDLANKIIKN